MWSVIITIAREFTGGEAARIYWDFYNHGRDEINYDCCQLIYLDPCAIIKTESWWWRCQINNRLVPYRRLEESYVEMVSDFINKKWKNLWDARDGWYMALAVEDRMRNEGKYDEAQKMFVGPRHVGGRFD